MNGFTPRKDLAPWAELVGLNDNRPAAWGTDGPWATEPDAVAWGRKSEPPAPRILMRHPELGTWCGYVAVFKGHPLFGKKELSEVREAFAEAGHAPPHGGITFSGEGGGLLRELANPPPAAATDAEREAYAAIVASLTESGKDFWFIGFDCAHGGDLVPAYHELGERAGARYVDLMHARVHCERLGQALSALAGNEPPARIDVVDLGTQDTDPHPATAAVHLLGLSHRTLFRLLQGKAVMINNRALGCFAGPLVITATDTPETFRGDAARIGQNIADGLMMALGAEYGLAEIVPAESGTAIHLEPQEPKP